MQSGLHGDPRATNPNPGEPPYPPFLGITDWPLVTSVMSAALTVAFFGYLGVAVDPPAQPTLAADRRDRSLLRRRAGPARQLGDFRRSSIHGSRTSHCRGRTSNASPLLEPTLSFLGGYASYYVLTGLGLLSIHRRFIEPQIRLTAGSAGIGSSPCLSPDSLRGCRFNALMQFMWLKVGLFVYTEAAGPVLHVFGRDLPLYMVIYDSVLFAVVALLCVRDDSGRPAVVAKLAVRTTTVRMTVGRHRGADGRRAAADRGVQPVAYRR